MPPRPSPAQVRPALLLAFEVARGMSGVIGRPLPGRVRSLVRARRRPPNWASTMAQALEEDDGFRVTVAEKAGEEDLGRLAWLWLVRPEGWSDEVVDLLDAVDLSDERDKELRLARQHASSLERELANLKNELAAVSAAQAARSVGAEEQRRALSEMAVARQRAESRVVELERALAAGAETVADLRTELERAGERARTAEQRWSRAQQERAGLEARVTSLAGESEEFRARHAGLESDVDRLRMAVGSAVEAAAGSARQLGDALAEAAAALQGWGDAKRNRGAAAVTPDAGGVPGSTVPPVPPGGGSPALTGQRRRRPVPVPPGMLEQSAEAAAYFVRRTGMQIIVDGYNVALTSWAEPGPSRASVADLSALRRRLVDALSELAVRLQRSVTVVFDGTDTGGRAPVEGPARRWLRIIFSASSVEADQVIVAAVRDMDPDIPVVVATDDREVRDDVHRFGGNVISVAQLLAVLGRQANPGRRR